MRVLWRIQRSRGRIAAAVSTMLLATLAAGIGFAPVASASATGARSATHTAATVKPDEEVLYFGGSYPNLEECDASLQEVETNPYFAGGECVYQEDGTYWMWYILDLPVCGTTAALASTPATTRTGAIAGKLAEPAC